MTQWNIPAVQRVETAADLEHILFQDNMAAIEAPVAALDFLPFKNDERQDSDRLAYVMGKIRANGYDALEPVIVRLGRRGRWVIVDGGHRVTAAQRISKEILTNLWGPKVRSMYFLLLRTPLSNTRKPEETEAG